MSGVKPYHKRLLWLTGFSPGGAPTWPRSRGTPGMTHPAGHSHKLVRWPHTYDWSRHPRAVPQQVPGISWPGWRSCNGSERQMESACLGWTWPQWRSQRPFNMQHAQKVASDRRSHTHGYSRMMGCSASRCRKCIFSGFCVYHLLAANFWHIKPPGICVTM